MTSRFGTKVQRHSVDRPSRFRRTITKRRDVEREPNWFSAWLIVSVTRLIIDYWKYKTSPRERARRLWKWNICWFFAEVAITVCLLGRSIAHPQWLNFSTALAMILVIGFWRVNEIVYAFAADVLDVIAARKKTSSLTPAQRLAMLARSTFGLVVWFAVAYSALSVEGGFKCELKDFRDALYFSSVTLFGIGQEGQEVEAHLLRITQVYEGIAGFILLAVSISVYASRPDSGDA